MSKKVKYIAETTSGRLLQAYLASGGNSFKDWDEVFEQKVIWGFINYSFNTDIEISRHDDFPNGDEETYFDKETHLTYERVLLIHKIEIVTTKSLVWKGI